MMRKIFGAAVLTGALMSVHAAEMDTQIASQGGVVVTMADIDAFLQRMPEERRVVFLDSPKRIDQMVIGIIRNKQLTEQAIQLKIDQDPQVKGEIAFATSEILAKKRLDSFEKTIKIPSMTVVANEEYAAHKAEYVTESYMAVQHILITTKDRTDAEAKTLAEKVRAEALANPADFAKLVDKYSDDETKSLNQGIIRDAASGQTIAEFAAASKKLTKEGEISPVVKTKFGYHVLKLLRNAPARELTFAEVKDKIELKLKENYIADQRKTFLAGLDAGTPTVNPQIMDLLHKRYIPASVVTPEEAAKGGKTP
jgi:parvulin-like peptidyl-prolyl isomerase